jgi:hypothetical protein
MVSSENREVRERLIKVERAWITQRLDAHATSKDHIPETIDTLEV